MPSVIATCLAKKNSSSALNTSSALFRISAVSIDDFLLTTNPALFTHLDHLSQALLALTESETALSKQIIELVNRNNLSREDTKRLGAIARRLNRSGILNETEQLSVEQLLKLLNKELALQLAILINQKQHWQKVQYSIEETLDCESSRSIEALWSQCKDRSEISLLLMYRDPSFAEQCFAQGDCPHFWQGKKGRIRTQYLLRILSRAAFRTTPRDFHTYVGLLSIGNQISKHNTYNVYQGNELASIWIENLHELRKRSATNWPDNKENMILSLAPIHWQTEDRISFCVTDWDSPLKVQEVNLKNSSFLNAVLTPLLQSALPYSELQNQLKGNINLQEELLTEGFIGYLIKQGVIYLTHQPKQHFNNWESSINYDHTQHESSSAVTSKTNGYLDVYTRLNGHLPDHVIYELQKDFCTLGQLSRLIEKASRYDSTNSVEFANHNETSSITPVIELLKQQLLNVESESIVENIPPNKIATTQGDWPNKQDYQPYKLLIQHLQSKIDQKQTIQLNTEYLSTLGEAEWSINWPVDAFFRFAAPGQDYLAVFDEAFAAGSMDARFLDAACQLNLPTKHFQAYKHFLQILERDYGHAFIELLFPPLSLGAANAVRRKPLVNLWTGDADCSTYFNKKNNEQFVSLQDLSIHQQGQKKRVYWREQQVFPMYHATRLPMAPWNLITDTLLNAVPFIMRWAPRRLHRLLDAFPNATYAPRLQLEGGLVVCCEQWRLPKALPWGITDSIFEKSKKMRHMVTSIGLPEAVMLSPAPGHRPTPCLFNSIHCLNTLEDIYAKAQDLLAIAMTPDPKDALLKSSQSPNRRNFSTTMLRFPLDEDPEMMATRLGPLLGNL